MSLACDFLLDKKVPCFKAGEKVEGSIELRVPDYRFVKDISIKLQGEASVCFTEYMGGTHILCDSDTSHDSDDCPNKQRTEFTGENLFLDLKHNLTHDCNLEPGEYSYRFSFTLPDDCVTAVELTKGSIEYFLMVVIRRQDNKQSKFRYSINVEGIYDLNLEPDNRKPVSVQHVKSLSWINLSSGKISFSLTIPQGAYVPLEILKYALHVDNKSSTEVKGYKAVLKMTVVYTATNPYEREYTDVHHIVEVEYDDECPTKCKRVFEYDFEIPPTVPSTDDDNIIDISYSLDITVNLNGLTFDVDLSVPIDIGTVALTNQSIEGPTTSSSAMAPALPRGPSATYQQFQPPSFAQATGNNVYPPLGMLMPSATAPPLDIVDPHGIGFRKLNN